MQKGPLSRCSRPEAMRGAIGVAQRIAGGRFERISLGAVLEPPAIVAGLDDLAVVGEAIEQRGGHFGVDEDARPFSEGEIGGDDHGGALVEFADQMEEQLPASLKRMVTARSARVLLAEQLASQLPRPSD